MSVRDLLWRLRHRRSRKEANAFSFGMEVGAVISDQQRRTVAKRVEDLF